MPQRSRGARLELAPVIGEALEALRATEGCLLARMSGSGSACFGLYASVGEAIDAAATIARASARLVERRHL